MPIATLLIHPYLGLDPPLHHTPCSQQTRRRLHFTSTLLDVSQSKVLSAFISIQSQNCSGYLATCMLFNACLISVGIFSLLSGSAVHCLQNERTEDEFSKQANELMLGAERALQIGEYREAEKAYQSAVDMFGKSQEIHLNADVVESVSFRYFIQSTLPNSNRT